ncbi:MAG: hypothetical protein K940chlam9_00046 [Chlamydiae bacterium]|nr:hypothetical protein [Chlamydiota bacterium]
MLRIALKMLLGDKAKFLALILGLTFATFIITQQAGIFTGLMQRTYGFLTDTNQPNIWVMDDQVQYIDDVKPIRFSNLYLVRGIQGVEWAVPMFKGLIKARLQNGQFQTCNVVGIDDASLIGGPPQITAGKLTDLRRPDAVIVDEIGARKKLSSPRGQGDTSHPLHLGQTFELNDLRAQVVGFCKLTRTFLSQPVIYTTFSRAVNYTPSERNLMTFVLARSKEGVSPKEVCTQIRAKTGLAAYTTNQFKWLTLIYYFTNTGIPINFGVAVLLGVFIGIAISGQTFYTFAHDNRELFATFKAMGGTNNLLTKMILTQALMVATIGWGIGIGATSLFGMFAFGTELSFVLPWWLMLGSGLAIYLITIFSALFGIRMVIKLEPGIVFQT